MFHLLVLSYANGDVLYVGPFNTKERAGDYAVSVLRDAREGAARMPSRWHTVPMITPLAESAEFARQKLALQTLEAM